MKKPSGFTLVEMMVTIAILAIIVTIAVPSFQSLIDDSRVTTATNDLVAALQVARSEALTRRQDVSVCKAGDDWKAGWRVRAASDCSKADNVIRVWDAPSSTLTVTGPDAVTFRATGGLPDSGAAVEFDLKGAQCSGNQQRAVTVLLGGRVSASRIAC